MVSLSSLQSQWELLSGFRDRKEPGTFLMRSTGDNKLLKFELCCVAFLENEIPENSHIQMNQIHVLQVLSFKTIVCPLPEKEHLPPVMTS